VHRGRNSLSVSQFCHVVDPVVDLAGAMSRASSDCPGGQRALAEFFMHPDTIVYGL